MNVLLASMALDIGGAETHVVGLAKELKKMGYGPVIVSAGGIYVKELIEENIPHYKAPLNKKDFRSIFTSIQTLKYAIRKEKIDIIHAHGRIPALNSKIVSLMENIPFMTTVHAKFKASLIYKHTTFLGKEVISISEDIKNHLIDKFNADPKTITIIPNGIDINKFNPNINALNLKSELKLKKDTMKIAYISRISGPLATLVKMVIEAGKELYKDMEKVEIIIAGDGDDFKEISEYAYKINEECNSDFIHILGKRTDIPEILSIADLAICVSRSALEAMACEKPVILAGGEGYMGLLTENNMEAAILNNFTGRTSSEELTVDKLKKEILTILDSCNKEKRDRLGQLGRRIVIDQFSIKSMTERTIEIYNKLLKGV
ncbi:glycosyltransferase [Paramaledivibacter caminithermalis]|jgi:glycosyltransferase involved in cell wall biosynthesis|uniref:Glycosyltransferase involved in cell wall bisynthesis n=1 Tax=Paramaledivibacter caminithermalis (strain DSM 15212 / CIP 107654 / DViRD3) TaxID=1121301 RepID=A0A1M6KSK3_PARC5|nr:glycosyltransferase [Paramaledivibacter caminithermalis]SHJ61919.1 Glycosyltransferase involved in cell wall bisynthesis [Paramaledivibacter caminithermalis DSM 15212]